MTGGRCIVDGRCIGGGWECWECWECFDGGREFGVWFTAALVESLSDTFDRLPDAGCCSSAIPAAEFLKFWIILDVFVKDDCNVVGKGNHTG